MKVSMKVGSLGGRLAVNGRRAREEGRLPFGYALRILAARRSSGFRGFMKARSGVLSVFHSVGDICNTEYCGTRMYF